MSCVRQSVNAGRLLAPSRVCACVREWWCAMLKRALKLAEAKKKAETTKPAAKRPSPADFSLRESPLTRVLCFQVGRGQAATTMQNIAQAAVSEAGAGNVSKSSCAACVAKPFNVPQILNIDVLSTERTCITERTRVTEQTCISCFCSYPRHSLDVLDGQPWGMDVPHRGHAS